MDFLSKYFRDPISGLTHLAGAVLGVVGFTYLVAQASLHGTRIHVISFSIFAASLILLYSSSALYHLLHVSESRRLIFRRIDHTMIFVLIAGSYTPFCLIPLKGPWGWSILGVVWGLAFLGLFRSFLWVHAPRWFSTGIYLFMGWIVIVAIFPLVKSLSSEGLFWLLAGGFFYNLGAIIYGMKKPNPFPPHFGFHEIWHLLVLAGSACHFMSVTTLLP